MRLATPEEEAETFAVARLILNPDDDQQNLLDQETATEDPAGFIVAVIQNATEKARIAIRNLPDDLADDDRAKIAEAIDALIRKWTSVKRKVVTD